jgi:hypothetical protein
MEVTAEDLVSTGEELALTAVIQVLAWVSEATAVALVSMEAVLA